MNINSVQIRIHYLCTNPNNDRASMKALFVMIVDLMSVKEIDCLHNENH